ncbi:MAG: oxidoreductase [Alicyclobacillus sp.]|nr:oxidoreductase [Alicyclobacillus sp.]
MRYPVQGGSLSSDPTDVKGTEAIWAEQIRRRFGRSLHIRHIDSGSCNGCEFEMMALLNPVYDIQRFGIDFVASPRHADMLLITGGVTYNLLDAVLKTYEAAPGPKMAVAVGACACGDSLVGPTYAHLGGLENILPVCVYVPGCPPRPQVILQGILAAIHRADELRNHGSTKERPGYATRTSGV